MTHVCDPARRRPPSGRHRRSEVRPTDFRWLFVCTGNICRSPLAQLLTQHLLGQRLGERDAGRFQLSSAGVRAVVGAGMHPDSRGQLSARQLDGPAADRFQARQLSPAMIDSAHLVLGASRHHRSAVVERSPAALARTFGLREFARLAAYVDPAALPTDPVARAHALVEEASLVRGLAPPVGSDGDRVPDPMGRPESAHRSAAQLIEHAVVTILDVISPPPGRRP